MARALCGAPCESRWVNLDCKRSSIPLFPQPLEDCIKHFDIWRPRRIALFAPPAAQRAFEISYFTVIAHKQVYHGIPRSYIVAMPQSSSSHGPHIKPMGPKALELACGRLDPGSGTRRKRLTKWVLCINMYSHVLACMKNMNMS